MEGDTFLRGPNRADGFSNRSPMSFWKLPPSRRLVLRLRHLPDVCPWNGVLTKKQDCRHSVLTERSAKHSIGWTLFLCRCITPDPHEPKRSFGAPADQTSKLPGWNETQRRRVAIAKVILNAYSFPCCPSRTQQSTANCSV